MKTKGTSMQKKIMKVYRKKDKIFNGNNLIETFDISESKIQYEMTR